MDPETGPWIYGFAATGIRSLRDEHPIRVGPLGRLNFLVGRNNHGKSSLLQAVKWWADGRTGAAPAGVTFETLVVIERASLLKAYQRFGNSRAMLSQAIEQGGLIELEEGRFGLWGSATESPHRRPAESYWAPLGLGPWRPSNLQQVLNEKTWRPKMVFIPAFRQIRPADPDKKSPALESGEGLIRTLQGWERPVNPGTANYDAARAKWVRVRNFMRDVLEDDQAELEVASNGTDLHVKLSQHGSMLHIDQLGDGIKQVLMIAATNVAYNDHFVCLEEPEIHLHAGLQRKLMHFLAKRTNNQYLIATHSAHALDSPDGRIFHVTHDGTTTRVAPAVKAAEVQRVCADLGYLASDLLQSNYTIWVEGPSDRLYWRHWIHLVDPALVEGVHYVVMVYGGRLIESVHLLPDPVTEADLIQLLRLGRSTSVIADSDRRSGNHGLSPTIQRLREESLQPGSGQLLVCEWVRTVENLVPRESFRRSVVKLHPVAGKRLRVSDDPFEQPFAGMKAGTYSKVQVANEVVRGLERADMSDELVEVVGDLASRIRKANGLPA